MLTTFAIVAMIVRRVPLDRLSAALSSADYQTFLALMIPNTIVYFCWDTLVLGIALSWFHSRVAYRDLLPVRASSYVVAFFNTNLGRGALAAYLSKRLGVPLLQIAGTVLFLVLTEYTHLVAWATVGILLVRRTVPPELLWAPVVVAVFWLLFFAARRWIAANGRGRLHQVAVRAALARPDRCVQIVLVRAPMFFLSLCVHYLAAPTFGIEIPFAAMMAFLPVIFMIAALPITVAHLGTTQAAWIFFFSRYATPEQLLAFSLAAHLTFTATRVVLGLVFLPQAWVGLTGRSVTGTCPRPTDG